MSDRREAVAKAIEEADRRFWQNRIQGGITYFPLLADAAIAAMDAEPTEAEVEATCPECGGHGRGCSFCGGTGDWPRTSEPTADEIIAAADAIEEICPSLRDAYPDGPSYTAPVVLAKAALIAARNARHE